MDVTNEFVISSGSPLQIAAEQPPTLFTRIFLQCQPAAGAGLIYVFRGVPPGTTPSISTWPYTTLAAGGATSPSDDYTDRVDMADDFAFNGARIWIDGSHTGDVVTLSGNRKV
jgi:hypothetical protein